MTKDELAALRNKLQASVALRRKLGDYDANAGGVREAHEALLALTQHLLDRMR